MTGENEFRIRPGRIRDRGRQAVLTPRSVLARPGTFVGEVQQAMRRAGHGPCRPERAGMGSGRCNARGWDAQIAAGLKGKSGWGRDASGVRTRARRVAVTARIVKLNPQRAAAVDFEKAIVWIKWLGTHKDSMTGPALRRLTMATDIKPIRSEADYDAAMDAVAAL